MFPAPTPKNFSRLAALKDRAALLGKARAFFAERGILEVDCPHITAGASIDAHIDLIPILYENRETRYLCSSPEYGMKRLLAEGIGDIYQLAHVFRDGERGAKHNPEFMMAEWYRIGVPFPFIIEETIDFIHLFLGPLPHEILSYRDAFLRFVGLDYVEASIEDLLARLRQESVPIYPGAQAEGKDALLNLLLGALVEPFLGQENLLVLTHYPASQAALAQIELRGTEQTAKRFEVYYRGIELANGYHELTDPIEQRRRFIKANEERIRQGKNPLPLDEHFLAALEKGIPDCCGVAVGFDRLMMARHQTREIKETIPFDWFSA